MRNSIPATDQSNQLKMSAQLPALSAITARCQDGCFAAGTLVHTKEGPRPIEEIQVGDWVLSKPESGQGEREYKRVTKTVASEERIVRWLSIGGLQNEGIRRYCNLVVTPEHPIWVESRHYEPAKKIKQGWRAAEKVRGGFPYTNYVEVLNPKYAPTSGEFFKPRPDEMKDPPERQRYAGNVPLFAAGPKDVAWAPSSSAALQSCGSHWHIPTMSVLNSFVNAPYQTEKGQPRIKQADVLFKTTVYNLAVEDFHTYYVGNMGVWVHALDTAQAQSAH